MSAVGIAQAASLIVVFREEKRRVGIIGSVFAEQPIDRLHEPGGFVDRDGALAAEIGLKIRHKQSSGDSLARNVADDQTKSLPARGKKIVVITANLASLLTCSGVIQGPQRRQVLRKE